MLRFGPATGPVVVVALPLFEEANRTRAFAVTVLRALADHGIAGALPDLPGQGESLLPTHKTTITKMREAFEGSVNHLARPAFALGIRSGALLDTFALVQGRWHLSPMSGADLLRELVRTRQASARESGETFDPSTLGTDLAAPPVELAGNLVSHQLLSELSGVSPMTGVARTVRIQTEAKPADAKLLGSPLWRRAEPDNDPAFAQAVADDIAQWIATCAG